MTGFTVWVDGDSCPGRLRRIIERASASRTVVTVFVSDRKLPLEAEGGACRSVVVGRGKDAADDYIVDALRGGDVVITRDVSLTARAVAAGALVLDSDGRLYDSSNVGERSSIYRFMSELRRRGEVVEKGLSRTGADRNASFANAYDRLLTSRTGTSGAKEPPFPGGRLDG